MPALRKKTIKYSLLAVVLILAVFSSLAWQADKQRQNAIKWVQSHKGIIHTEYPMWIDKWPVFLHSILKKGVGEKVIYINLNYTQVSDLAPIKNLTHLQELELNSTQVKDLKPLESLTELTGLILTATKVEDLSSLGKLSKLEGLHIHDTKVSDLSSLKNLANLKLLLVTDSKVSNEEIGELQKHLPNCKIIHN